MAIGNFSLNDLQNSRNWLTNLLEEVSSEEGRLAGASRLGKGGEALQGLKETEVTFGNPTNNLIRLNEKLFSNIGIQLSEIHKIQMRDQFDFYYMTLSVSMKPKRGAQFTRVECELEFKDGGLKEPIIQTMFPKSEWREVLSWGVGMNLALNGDLEWGVGIDLAEEGNINILPDDIKARIFNKNELNAFVAAPNYSYKLGHSEIVATGEGNSICFWRIEKPELQMSQTVQFSIVFKVPKKTKSINLTGIVAAEVNINWLVAQIRNVLEDLSDKLQNLFRKEDDERKGWERLPLGDQESWIIDLPH